LAGERLRNIVSFRCAANLTLGGRTDRLTLSRPLAPARFKRNIWIDMANLHVEPVESRRQQKQFVNFPWTLYAGDPKWVPPLLGEHKRLLGYHHHPFYDQASVQTFLALRGGEVVGRVAAVVNEGHNRQENEKRGFIGFFESRDDQEIATALFDTAAAWLKQKGMTVVRGPANPSINYEWGLLVEGYHSPPTFMMTYNPPYYGKLFEGWGFKKAQDLYAFWGHIDMVSKLDKKLWFIANEARERFKVKVRPMNQRKFRQEVEMFLRVYNTSMAGSWGFSPLSPAEVKTLAGGLKHLIAPELALVAEVEGEPIGAVLGLLDYNPRIKAIDGRLFPFGFIKLIRNKHALKKMRVVSINVVPEYQRWGLGVVLLGGLIPPIQKWGMHEAEFSWVVESNTLSRGSLEKGGAKLDKIYRVYDREL
jgi:GNAT superfamily N-acetyltransferase